ncbi:MAG: ATP synthase F1 subunit epsilon [Candidatus Dadabacteria bacterium]|nr:ATP synthase F1 subunit epsilon [Candidatus Dadabacteria bacterium]
MAEKLHLEIITPLELVLSEEVDEVVAPGEVGEFGILPGHIPFLSLLSPGELKYTSGGTETRLIVWGGLADIREDRVKVLVDGVERPEDIEPEEAKAELDKVSEEMKSFEGDSAGLKELQRRLRLAELRASAGA